MTSNKNFRGFAGIDYPSSGQTHEEFVKMRDDSPGPGRLLAEQDERMQKKWDERPWWKKVFLIYE